MDKDEFIKRFVDHMVSKATPRTDDWDVKAYALDVAESYYEEMDDGDTPESLADTDMSYWEKQIKMDINKQYYIDAANKIFSPSAINDPDDEQFMIHHCLDLMRKNKVMISDDPDEWLHFVYRAIELCELQENGYCYKWVINR